jgi:hypothetical protein
MAGWSEIEVAAPELTALARRFFDLRRHMTLATLRRDGSPRISGTETDFREGQVYIGSMWQAVKALDLQRDPRFALHSGSDDPPDWRGDAKIAGRAEEITDPGTVARINEGAPGGRSHLFRLDVTELVVVRLGDPADHLVIDSWHEGRGLSSIRR